MRRRAARIVSPRPQHHRAALRRSGSPTQLVGRTGFCIHPWETVRTIPKVGGTKDVKLDQVRELAPTHVVVNVDENLREDAEALARVRPARRRHPPAGAARQPRPLPAARRRLRPRGRGRAALRASSSAPTRGRPRRERPPRDVLYLIWREPWMTVAPDTYIAQTLALFNWRTAVRREDCDRSAIRRSISAASPAGSTACCSAASRSTSRSATSRRSTALSRAPQVSLIDGEMTSWYGIAGDRRARLPGRVRGAMSEHRRDPSRDSGGPIESPCIDVCVIDERERPTARAAGARSTRSPSGAPTRRRERRRDHRRAGAA